MPTAEQQGPGADDRGSRADDAWDAEERHETPTERLDRNWTELLQELRVVQTGVQLLTGFLLTLPFQNRFSQLSSGKQDIYLITVLAAVAATCFLIAPVALHRTLFRRHARRVTVAVAHRLAVTGLVLFAAATVGVVLLIFQVVRSVPAGITAAMCVLVLLVLLWLVLPLYLRQHQEH
ncbi:MAG TPA: DUF6328 family protein [Jatrophihabitans sp.]|nr:DUF6328 family protein [Jatrophihabitans sp.]